MHIDISKGAKKELENSGRTLFIKALFSEEYARQYKFLLQITEKIREKESISRMWHFADDIEIFVLVLQCVPSNSHGHADVFIVAIPHIVSVEVQSGRLHPDIFHCSCHQPLLWVDRLSRETHCRVFSWNDVSLLYYISLIRIHILGTNFPQKKKLN